jgi:hypothetical protein
MSDPLVYSQTTVVAQVQPKNGLKFEAVHEKIDFCFVYTGVQF